MPCIACLAMHHVAATVAATQFAAGDIHVRRCDVAGPHALPLHGQLRHAVGRSLVRETSWYMALISQCGTHSILDPALC